ncbi:dockerin type I repeat-containing protein [Acetivibrio cellulolyticus]|uniref:dockerin type I repeat-containing protein n=1 Tax=Acetivibrio cellulolyticus TaxID=35830 RepID=UPI0001E2F63B|nr:dockerin type I repeat-containing protein [Acetivibrio cellulolyticus]
MIKSVLFQKPIIVKIVAFLLITVLSISFSSFVHSAEVVYGDVNGSGKVDSIDFALMRSSLLGISSGFPVSNGMTIADVNADGSFNSIDFALMRSFLLGIITKFPADGTPIATPVPTSTPKKGNVTYTLEKVSNPTDDQKDAYDKIQSAMDKAVSFYNDYTTIKKSLKIVYETSVSTADGNINGTIRFGSNRSYMNHITAMHEIAHTVGVGTSSKWSSLIVNNVYTGTYATAEIRAITGDNSAVLKGDSMHFWPYGLNYTSEVKSDQDLINHCKIVEAMKKDGI